MKGNRWQTPLDESAGTGVFARPTGEPGVIEVDMLKCVACGADRALETGHAVAVFKFRSNLPNRRRGKSISKDAVRRASLYCYCRACKRKVPRPTWGRPMKIRQMEMREADFYDSVAPQDPREVP